MAQQSPIVGNKFTSAIELENRNRFFRRNLGYVDCRPCYDRRRRRRRSSFGGLQDQDISILVGLGSSVSLSACSSLPLLQCAVRRRRLTSSCWSRSRWRSPFSPSSFDHTQLLPALLRGIASDGLPALRRCMADDPVSLRAGGGVHVAQRAVPLFDAGADRARPPDHGSARRLPALSGNGGGRPPQHAGARKSPPSVSKRCCPMRSRSMSRNPGRTPSGRRCAAPIRAMPIRCGTTSRAGAAAAAGRAAISAARLPRPSAACRAPWRARCRFPPARRDSAAAEAARAAVVAAAAGEAGSPSA